MKVILLTLRKPPNGIEKIHTDFSEERKEKKPARRVGVFLPKCRYYSIAILYKIGFLNHMVILELGGNASYNDLSQLINTLSNKVFACLDKCQGHGN